MSARLAGGTTAAGLLSAKARTWEGGSGELGSAEPSDARTDRGDACTLPRRLMSAGARTEGADVHTQGAIGTRH